MTATMTRSILLLCFLLLRASALHSAEKLRIAYPTLGPGSTPSWVTTEACIWKKHGLSVLQVF